MTTLDTILAEQARQLTIAEFLAEIEAENRAGVPLSGVAAELISSERSPRETSHIPISGPESHPSTARLSSPKSSSGQGNGLEPGASVGHVDFADFRGIYVGSGRRPGIALVKVVAGWTCEPPPWPVSVPYSKLVEV